MQMDSLSIPIEKRISLPLGENQYYYYCY